MEVGIQGLESTEASKLGYFMMHPRKGLRAKTQDILGLALVVVVIRYTHPSFLLQYYGNFNEARCMLRTARVR